MGLLWDTWIDNLGNGVSQDTYGDQECLSVPGVDEECINKWLQFGEHRGPWVPGFTDCHTFAHRVLDFCSIEYRESVDDDSFAICGASPQSCMPF